MQFQVPQFLDVEDKVIGPLTIKQFLYIAGSVGLGYMSYRYITFLGIGFLLGLGFIALGVALGFYRPNKKPFADMIESAFNYIKGVRLYVWKRQNTKSGKSEVALDLNNFQTTKHSGGLPISGTGNKLSDLSWTMDLPSNTVTENTHEDSAVI